MTFLLTAKSKQSSMESAHFLNHSFFIHKDSTFSLQLNLINDIFKEAGWQENGVGKCSHGGRLDHSRNIPALGGINKETTEYLLSPHNSIHDQSGTVSTQAASQFLVDKGVLLVEIEPIF